MPGTPKHATQCKKSRGFCVANSCYFEARATFDHAMAMDHASDPDCDAYHALATIFDALAARMGADQAAPWLRTLKQPRVRSADPARQAGNWRRTAAAVGSSMGSGADAFGRQLTDVSPGLNNR